MVNVFQKGPWFLYGFFLSVQRWIPNFVASKATQSYTAIWIRLPQLPTEFYDKEILQKVGSSIGRLLKVDACTSVALRGRYARLCVELPLNKPVTPFLFIDSHKQFILYEGDKLLCTSCGLLGHTKPQCHHPKSMQKQESPSKDLETPQTRNTKPEEIWHTVPFNRSKQRDPTKRTSKLPDISQDPGISVNIFEAKSGKFLSSQNFCYKSRGQLLQASNNGKSTSPTTPVKNSNSFLLLNQNNLDNNPSINVSKDIITTSTNNNNYNNIPINKITNTDNNNITSSITPKNDKMDVILNTTLGPHNTPHTQLHPHLLLISSPIQSNPNTTYSTTLPNIMPPLMITLQTSPLLPP